MYVCEIIIPLFPRFLPSSCSDFNIYYLTYNYINKVAIFHFLLLKIVYSNLIFEAYLMLDLSFFEPTINYNNCLLIFAILTVNIGPKIKTPLSKYELEIEYPSILTMLHLRHYP